MLVNNLYHDVIFQRIDEIKKGERNSQNRLVTIGHLNNAVDKLFCKEFVTEAILGERERCIAVISRHLAKSKTKFQSKEGFTNDYTVLLNNNASRRTNKILQRSKITS